MKSVVSNNKKYKIKTDKGFSDFVGVMKKKSNNKFKMMKITTKEGNYIQVTENHKIFSNEMIKKPANEYHIGDMICIDNGYNTISNIQYIEPKDTVYDVLHVLKNNRHYIKGNKYNDNGILIEQCILVDEIAFVKRADEFYESIYPTITSGDKTKIIFTSTPNGMNFFYKMWMDAENGRSDYIAYDVKWYEHPERGEDWYKTITKNMNKKSVNQEIHCVSGDTNITVNGKKIKIEELYNHYNKVNNTKLNDIVYIQDNIIVNNINK